MILKFRFLINNEFKLETIAPADIGANLNCIQEGLVPTKYNEETIESLRAANVPKLKIKYKLSNVNICNQGTCFKTTFLLVKDLS